MTQKRHSRTRRTGRTPGSPCAKATPFRESRLCRLVYEDDCLLVVDKQAGALTVPTAKRELNTVVAALCRYVSQGSRRRTMVSIVHRLDRDTSGILVFAKDPRTAELLIEQFKAHVPRREYVAIVSGRLERERGTFESRLVTDRFLNQRSTRDEDRGKRAVTHYRVLELLSDTSLVSVVLDTGRRNQIRVHFAERGHPVLGDRRYQARLADHPRWRTRRLALHARLLGLSHPVTGEELRFESPTPRELEVFISGERRRAVRLARG